MRVTVTWQRFSTKPVASSSDYSSSEDNSAADNGGSAPARTNRKVSDGSLGSLFFWQDDSAPTARAGAGEKEVHERSGEKGTGIDHAVDGKEGIVGASSSQDTGTGKID